MCDCFPSRVCCLFEENRELVPTFFFFFFSEAKHELQSDNDEDSKNTRRIRRGKRNAIDCT